MQKILSAAAIALAFTSAAHADTMSCGEWSASSLQDAGEISISISAERLVWSNGRRAVEAERLGHAAPPMMFADSASIYLVWEHDRSLEIRRIYTTEQERPSARLSCG
jgi:hypothetical protein